MTATPHSVSTTSPSSVEPQAPDLLLRGGRVTTLDTVQSEVTAVLLHDGRVAAIGADREVTAAAGPGTHIVELAGRRVVPGLNDSHLHLVRGGLNWSLELRWDGVPSLADALTLLRAQAQRTPAGQWVRVVGGWSEHQFAEHRAPTLAELNAAAPDTPVFVLHLYRAALLNAAALRALGIDTTTPDPPGGHIERDSAGRPTGLLLATPSALILYSTLARAPRLSPTDQAISSRLFMRELNRLGVTSAIDAGGGAQSYPDDYDVISELAADNELTVRVAFNIFAQRAGAELDDYRSFTGLTGPGSDRAADRWYRFNGAGENVVWAAADFENFTQPRPDLGAGTEDRLADVLRLLVGERWPFRLHATYDQTMRRMLDVIERVDREVGLGGLRWFFDHAETATPATLERIAALGGGLAVQNRMAFQGEAFAQRYGAAAAATAPPLRRALDLGLSLGAGTDATRVSSYNPWYALHWLVSGRTAGGLLLRDGHDRLDRFEALRSFTNGAAWFSGEQADKGRLTPGYLADLAVLSEDYFTVAEERIPHLYSVLTVVGGRIVHGAAEHAALAPPSPAPSPDWSPLTLPGHPVPLPTDGHVDPCLL